MERKRTMNATTEKLRPWVVACAGGRDLATQLRDVETQGQHGAPQPLRGMALAANGFSNPPDRADLALVFGCYRPFSTPYILREIAWLLAALGIRHTWLEKEYCCGLPLMHQVAAKDRQEMKEKAGRFVEANRSAAGSKGAKAIAYCCAGCAHVARSVALEGGQEFSPEHTLDTAPDAAPSLIPDQAYILDTLLDALRGRALSAPSGMHVAYFEGCHSSYRKYFPDSSLNWGGYRSFLDSVGGLVVRDVAAGRCCKKQAAAIVDEAERAGAQALVCPCSGCTVALRAAGRERLKIMSYPELLARCLGATGEHL